MTLLYNIHSITNARTNNGWINSLAFKHAQEYLLNNPVEYHDDNEEQMHGMIKNNELIGRLPDLDMLDHDEIEPYFKLKPKNNKSITFNPNNKKEDRKLDGTPSTSNQTDLSEKSNNSSLNTDISALSDSKDIDQDTQSIQLDGQSNSSNVDDQVVSPIVDNDSTSIKSADKTGSPISEPQSTSTLSDDPNDSPKLNDEVVSPVSDSQNASILSDDQTGTPKLDDEVKSTISELESTSNHTDDQTGSPKLDDEVVSPVLDSQNSSNVVDDQNASHISEEKSVSSSLDDQTGSPKLENMSTISEDKSVSSSLDDQTGSPKLDNENISAVSELKSTSSKSDDHTGSPNVTDNIESPQLDENTGISQKDDESISQVTETTNNLLPDNNLDDSQKNEFEELADISGNSSNIDVDEDHISPQSELTEELLHDKSELSTVSAQVNELDNKIDELDNRSPVIKPVETIITPDDELNTMTPKSSESISHISIAHVDSKKSSFMSKDSSSTTTSISDHVSEKLANLHSDELDNEINMDANQVNVTQTPDQLDNATSAKIKTGPVNMNVDIPNNGTPNIGPIVNIHNAVNNVPTQVPNGQVVQNTGQNADGGSHDPNAPVVHTPTQNWGQIVHNNTHVHHGTPQQSSQDRRLYGLKYLQLI